MVENDFDAKSSDQAISGEVRDVSLHIRFAVVLIRGSDFESLRSDVA